MASIVVPAGKVGLRMWENPCKMIGQASLYPAASLQYIIFFIIILIIIIITIANPLPKASSGRASCIRVLPYYLT